MTSGSKSFVCVLFNLRSQLTRFRESDVTYVNVAGSPIVILNTYEAAVELLEKRGNLYDDRPRMRLAGEMYVPLIYF